MKTCPFCAEEIKSAAVVCKHCGRDLPAPSASQEENPVGAISPIDATSNRRLARRLFIGLGGFALLAVLVFVSDLSRPPSQSFLPGSHIADAPAPEAFRAVVVSAGESCDRVTRIFRQGVDGTGAVTWNVACANENAYAIRSTAQDSKVLACSMLKAVTKLDCFKTFDEQRR